VVSHAPAVHRLERVGSTQDEAHRLAAAGAPAGTAIVAERQTAGRGSRGRRWDSPAGGLWMSVISRPAAAAGVELLSLRAGLATAVALDGLGGLPRVELKWPNDVLLGGSKVGGILCEARWQGEALAWAAVGIGLNVRNRPPAGARLPGTRLAEWRADLTPDDVLRALLAELHDLAAGGPTLARPELVAWGRRDWLRGRTLHRPVAGTVEGIAADGALRVRRADATLELVRSGDATPAIEF
jgi:BirA family transcriptional regulator, biotin operon repressor / biotin---[acetyl-CoA-carboxylase] ligase